MPSHRRKPSRPAKRSPLQWGQILPLLPLALAVGVLPLVVFLKVVPVPVEYRPFWPAQYVFDFFSYYKARLVLVCAFLVLVVLLLNVWRGRLKPARSRLYIPLAVFALLTCISALASRHPFIALGGFFDRDEGLWVLLAYLLLLLGAWQLVESPRQAWIVLAAWAAALTVICILGLFQFFSLDFFTTSFGRLLILPAQAHSIASSLSFNFPRYTIYATLYNPNYVASMLCMAFPLAAAAFLHAHTPRLRVLFGLLAGLLTLALVGANGRVGWIAAALALGLVVALSLRRGSPGWWKRLLLLMVFAGLAFVGLDLASQGYLSERAGEPVSQAGQILQGAAGQPDAASLPQPQQSPSEGLAERLIRKYGQAASGRGYIWIRSLQMAPQTALLGRGPDTFTLYFPNSDPYKAFYNPYARSEILIDKPHNLYIQSWLNLGGLATLAFLALLGMHFVRTLRLLRRARPAGEAWVLALGLFAGWCAYLLAAFFYDSNVSVAPVFWVLFGLSLSMNARLESAVPSANFA
jgi:hypothetical protein